jgi:hypothetical protein
MNTTGSDQFQKLLKIIIDPVNWRAANKKYIPNQTWNVFVIFFFGLQRIYSTDNRLFMNGISFDWDWYWSRAAYGIGWPQTVFTDVLDQTGYLHEAIIIFQSFLGGNDLPFHGSLFQNKRTNTLKKNLDQD